MLIGHSRVLSVEAFSELEVGGETQANLSKRVLSWTSRLLAVVTAIEVEMQVNSEVTS